MNAIIALCHFCEAHGPCPIFCTQTLRDLRIDELVCRLDATDNGCPGCISIGNSMGIVSQDVESDANFLSTQTTVLSDIAPLIKQAAVRSLSCEVTGNKGGNLIFFGDATRGHILSYTFQIHDSQARGFFRLFSVVILMKDKMFLLNIQPFLSENLQKFSAELQRDSAIVNAAEQAKYSERAQRLNSGQASTQPPRSLVELTGQKNIFAHIHSHFAWILLMGARCLTENITIGAPTIPPWIANEQEEFTVTEVDKEEWLLKRLGIEEDNESLRNCKELLGAHFVAVFYCVIVGIQIVVSGPQAKTLRLIKCLRKLLPDQMHKLTQTDCYQYLPPSVCRILSVLPQVVVPQPSVNLVRIDFPVDSDDVLVKWLGGLPNKYPDFLVKVLKAIDEKLLNDFVLNKQIRSLVEEWKNKVLCMQKISLNQDMMKMKKVLGVQPQDQPLISYWSSFLTN